MDRRTHEVVGARTHAAVSLAVLVSVTLALFVGCAPAEDTTSWEARASCGNGKCNPRESCSTCPEDCGQCPATDAGTVSDAGQAEQDAGEEDAGSPVEEDAGSETDAGSSEPCTDPVFVTSDPNGMWIAGEYIVHNNMWNISGYSVSETLYACAPDNWYVTATADNRSGDGAVKTYPNVHKDYHNWSTGAEPRLSSFSTITSTFAATSPHVGIYNVAYDIWLNGVPGNREVMIWTENYRQVPAGSRVASSVRLSGYTWDVYATSGNGYIALVPSTPMTSGSLDLKSILDWLVAQGRIPADSTLGQIGFGIEIVSTDGAPATFYVTDFSITDS